MLFSARAICWAFASTLMVGSVAAYNPAGEEQHCSDISSPQSDVNLCRTQDGAMCTLGYACYGDPGADEVSGIVSIYNNACTCINSFEEYNYASEGDDSVFPFTIQTSNLNPGLLYDTTITYSNCLGNDSPAISWSYNGANYDQSSCDCEGDGLQQISCRCSFPC